MSVTERRKILVVGSGFSGSLLASILQKDGNDVTLIDKSSHPRFAIGESSTPTAGFILKSLIDRYDLQELKPLTRYGLWREHLSEIGVGVKRLQRVGGRKPAAKRKSSTRWGPDQRRKKKKKERAEAQPEAAPVQPFVLSLNVDARSDDESDSSDDDEEFVITDDGCVDSDEDDEVDEDGVELPRKPLPRYRARDLDAYSEKALTWLSRQIYRRREPELIKGVAIAIDGEVGCSEFEAFEVSAKVHLVFTMLRLKQMRGGSLEECAKAALEVSPKLAEAESEGG